jgi:hypothetical protein
MSCLIACLHDSRSMPSSVPLIPARCELWASQSFLMFLEWKRMYPRRAGSAYPSSISFEKTEMAQKGGNKETGGNGPECRAFRKWSPPGPHRNRSQCLPVLTS